MPAAMRRPRGDEEDTLEAEGDEAHEGGGETHDSDEEARACSIAVR